MANPAADAITVVIPVQNASDALEKIVPGWGVVLEKIGRAFEILLVNDGCTDATATAVERLTQRVPRTRFLQHEQPRGFGACLRTALAEAQYPLFFYTAVNYPYTPANLRLLLERIDLRDEFLKKQPDLVSGCRTGIATPALVKGTSFAWRGFWRLFAGLPMQEPNPWHGWGPYWNRSRVRWVYGVPLADVNSCFKLFRTAFLKRFPIQSDGDFVHTELVAKATFLTSIMDEVALAPKPDAIPPLGATRADRKRVFRHPEFTFRAEPLSPPAPPQIVANATSDEAAGGEPTAVPTSTP